MKLNIVAVVIVAVMALIFAPSQSPASAAAREASRPGFFTSGAPEPPAAALGSERPPALKELWARIKDNDGADSRRANLKTYSELYVMASKLNLKSDALKAVLKKVLTEDSLGASRNIELLEAETAKADKSLKPVMQMILAEWYVDMLDELSRYGSPLAGHADESPARAYLAWQPPDFVRKIYSLCDDALADEKYLSNIPISEYSDFIENKGLPVSVCPTLFDYLAYKAFDICLQLDRHGIADKVAMSKVEIEARALGPAAEFLKYEPRLVETAEVDSNKTKLLQYYQKIIRVHLNEKSSDALAYADLARTAFAFYESSDAGGDKFSLLYRPYARSESAIKEYAGYGDLLFDALNDRAALYAGSIVSSQAYQWMAGVRKAQKRTAEALALAEKGRRLHPGTIWSAACGRIAEDIIAPSLEIYADKVFPSGPGASLKIVHKNIDRVYFRAVKENYRDYSEFGTGDKLPGLGSRKAVETAVAARPAAEWQVDLARPADYESTEEVTAIPELPRGFYRILASLKKDFSTAENEIRYAMIWVSDIEVVFRYDRGQGKEMAGFVTDRKNGKPVAGAAVTFSSDSSMYSEKGGALKTTTDRDGKFCVDNVYRVRYRKASAAVSTAAGDELALCNIEMQGDRELYVGNKTASTRAVLFCDRPIYRPGQRIGFKGVCVDADQEAGVYGVAAGLSVEVRLCARKYRNYEASDVVVSSQEAVTNEFGSFSGGFTAPSNEPGGEYFIQTTTPAGAVYFRVEEYKRPSFTVKINAPEAAFAYYDGLEFTGEVAALNGVPAPGAAVRYRVFAMPYWWELSCPQSDGSFMSRIVEVASGTTEANAGGVFEIKFAARPYSSKSRVDGSDIAADVTAYKVMIDATAGSGETVSAVRSFYIGRKPAYVLMSCSRWNDSNGTLELTITSETYNGIAAEIEGRVEIYELAQPEKVAVEDEKPSTDRYFHDDEFEGFNDAVDDYEDLFETRLKERARKPGPDFEFWPARAAVFSDAFKTGAGGSVRVMARLKPGAYRAVLEGRCGARGTPVKTYLPFIVVDGAQSASCVKTPLLLLADRDQASAGETVRFLCCSGFENCDISLDLVRGGKILRSYKVAGDAPQSFIDIPVAGDCAGDFSMIATLKKNGRAYMAAAYVKVPDASKKLSVELSSFAKTAAPGGEQTWTLKVKGPEGRGEDAFEIGAVLYDAALDAMAAFKKPSFDGLFYKTPSPVTAYKYSNYPIGFLLCHDSLSRSPERELDQPEMPDYTGEIKLGNLGSYIGGISGMKNIFGGDPEAGVWLDTDSGAENGRECSNFKFLRHERRQAVFLKCGFAEKLKRIAAFGPIMRTKGLSDDKPFASAGSPALDFSSIAARADFNEQAFFLPHIMTGPGGTAEITFTMPERLTKWRFRGFAHGKNLENGSCEAEVFTSKPFMLVTNPPRFVRNGDEIEFPAVIENAGAADLEGEAALTFETNGCSCVFVGGGPGKKFRVPAGGAVTLYWRIAVSGGPGALRFKCVARAGRFDDGEEGAVPVLSSVEALYDTVSISSREKGERKYRFEKIAELFGAGEGGARDSCELTVRVMPSPVWYVVSALPYLMVFPHECCEQTFNKLYANAVAKKIAGTFPSVRQAFETYRRSSGGSARGVFAADERPAALGDFFIADLFDAQIKKAYDKLSAAVAPDGFWPWFEGGRHDIDMTLYIMAGFGRLKKMKAGGFDTGLSEKCMNACDRWFIAGRDSLEAAIAEEKSSSTVRSGDRRKALARLGAYIYGRSHYLEGQKLSPGLEKTIAPALAVLKKEWKNVGDRLTLTRIALGFWRFGEKEEAVAVMNSIKKSGEEYKSSNLDFGWYGGSVEAAAAAVEGFVEILNDHAAADNYRAAIISRFVDSNWRTTTASADAVYALLLCGVDPLSVETSVEVSLGVYTLKLAQSGIWPGYFEKTFRGSEIKPEFADIIVDNPFGKMMFGELSLKYYQDISKVKTAGGGVVEISKSIVARHGSGEKTTALDPARSKIAPGDVLTVRLEIKSKSALRYVSIEDGRPCGFEPAGIVSRHKHAGGLDYYMTATDRTARFYLEYMPAGRHVIEYDIYAVHRGRFNSGPAFLECMYLPEFKSHSESVAIEVGDR